LRTTKILSLSFPPKLLSAAERLAKREGRTRSELFREALRRYMEEQKWRELQRYGARRAQRLGVTEADVERAIGEHRKGR
jgi:CopG family transcriptional regulator/antitoxin EndoAI